MIKLLPTPIPTINLSTVSGMQTSQPQIRYDPQWMVKLTFSNVHFIGQVDVQILTYMLGNHHK